uniref:Si:dkey-10o6.2 n=1 Tax=Sinocyclocheilus anshuiensis TaxID=1608454 RepID=A0A671Q2J2_9TELE
MEIPVVDFSAYELEKTNISVLNLEKLSDELRKAFTEVGFVYLKNSGINQDEVCHFLLVCYEKFTYRGSFSCNGNHGWISVETESLNPRCPGDLKEAFNTASLCSDINWPSEGVDDFRDVHVSFYLRCKELSLRVLRVMALGLNLEAEVFLSAHKHIGSDVNGTTLRTLYYPPVNSTCVKENQLRCGEHSDYGSITLVFQSSEGGLQVLNRAGEFISAPSIPGTVLINIADLMQRWTSDVYVSAVHRVLLPPAGDSSTRQSLAFFVQPDDEAIISCCDGSDKYPPVKSGDYLLSRFKDSYGKK